VLASGDRIELAQLPTTVIPEARRDEMPRVPGASIADLERFAILRTLESCGGSTSRAATILGISARKIQYKLHEYRSGMPVPPPSGAVPDDKDEE
jgi:DNA-binding NtrC family response regulator